MVILLLNIYKITRKKYCQKLAICKSRNGEPGNGIMGTRGITVGTRGIRVVTWGINKGMRGMGVGMWESGWEWGSQGGNAGNRGDSL